MLEETMLEGGALLSERAREFLERIGATRDGLRADEATLKDLITHLGLAAWPDLLGFEQRFGGLHFDWARYHVELGVIAMSKKRRARDMCLSPADERLLVGTEGDCDLFMDREGGILSCGPDVTLWPRASSIVKYIEQIAMFAAREQLTPDPFHLTFAPEGEVAAKRLALSLDEVASDDRRRFWTWNHRWLTQATTADWQAEWADLYCASFMLAVDALIALRNHIPNLWALAHGCEKSKKTYTFQREAVAVPTLADVEAWEHERMAIRFEGPEFFGKKSVVWLCAKDELRFRIEQYVWIADSGAVVEWSSFSADEQITRRYTVPQPVSPADLPKYSAR